MNQPLTPIARGLIAGAAGTVALNLASYLDMALRARPESDMPARLVLALAQRAGISALCDEGNDEQKQTASTRREAVGALLGFVNGLAVPVVFAAMWRERTPAFGGTAMGLAAMAASDAPAIGLGVTDPASWGVSGWISDLIPHLAYGWVTAATYDALSTPQPPAA